MRREREEGRDMENPRRRKRSLASPTAIKIPGFTPTDLAAAELLIHISESSGDSSAAAAAAPQRSVSSALSSSSSPISVASVARPPLRGPSHFAAGEDDEDDDAGFHRLRPRYRSLAEVYADFPRIDGDGRNSSAAAAAGDPAVRRRKRGDFD